MYSIIIHPTDLSEATVSALKTAYELARNLNSRLIICYVAHPPMVASGTRLTDPKSGQSRDIDDEIRSIQPLDPAVDSEVRVITIEESSDLKPLLTVLETMGGELMVIGVHKKRGVGGWWGRTITEEVVSQAHCDVLVVKHHEDDESGK